MSLNKNRSVHVLFALFLLIALAACGGTPTPPPEAGTLPPPEAGTLPPPKAATLTPTATSEPAQPSPTPTTAAQEAATATPTPTPTVVAQAVATTPAPEPSRCEGLAGQLEVQVLVGPADAVGLEPVAVGSVPWAASGSESPYLVQGQGPISYADTLTQDWGTYAVTMELDLAVQGDCSGPAGSEQLDLALEMTGEQLVEVKAEGFHGKYPWAGTHTMDLTFPIEEGATAQGEGWVIVLHVGS